MTTEQPVPTDQVSLLRDLDQRATQGPWAYSDVRYRRDALDWRNITASARETLVATALDLDQTGVNAALITLLRNSVPAILEMVEALEAASWLLADISPDGLVKKKIDAALATFNKEPSDG